MKMYTEFMYNGFDKILSKIIFKNDFI